MQKFSTQVLIERHFPLKRIILTPQNNIGLKINPMLFWELKIILIKCTYRYANSSSILGKYLNWDIE